MPPPEGSCIGVRLRERCGVDKVRGHSKVLHAFFEILESYYRKANYVVPFLRSCRVGIRVVEAPWMSSSVVCGQFIVTLKSG